MLIPQPSSLSPWGHEAPVQNMTGQVGYIFERRFFVVVVAVQN